MVAPVPITLIVPQDVAPDEDQDKAVPGAQVTALDSHLNPLHLPSLILGAGTFSNQYNSNDHLAGFAPMRLVRLALRYGLRAFDTSIYYGPSEVVLGNALKAVQDEFPRESYQLVSLRLCASSIRTSNMTKCGRFGATTFDYSPATIRNSVTQSLQRLQTDYLDTVYLHDIEFVCTPVLGKQTGNHALALTEEKASYGLEEGMESRICGEGDQKVLDAFGELRKMKDEGLIRNIGITGYPLPTLLRIALLILHNPPYEPVDVLLSYSHNSLQNCTFADFASPLRHCAKVKQLVGASPFSMGLLTPSIPSWHPAPEGLREVVTKARVEHGEEFVDMALAYAIRRCGSGDGNLNVPLVVGVSTPEEVHHCMRVWRKVQEGKISEEDREKEAKAVGDFREAGFLGWSWASP
ncbi:Aldo/keto reductase [Gymnopus androsaceus JB14]|uniref:Aldo/keto reductase n=1 Tax=Gymnopus androsaceus JB14 TaxID=1447944 RepID=A0A6A4HLM1_9AGAR|nr:Aldo/keto reductase [Gymnopus androsaceus JB14]